MHYTVLRVIIVGLFIFASLVSAQLEQTGEQLQGTLENVSNMVEKTREIIDNEKYDFVGAQWKEFLLQNRFIGPTHAFFERVDIAFVMLFGRHYTFSLTLFFALMLWLFTVIWTTQAAGAFFSNTGVRLIVGLLATVLVAQLQVFNKVSEAAFKVMFYKTSALWSFIIFIFLIVLLIVYFYVGRLLGKYLDNLKKLEEAHKLKHEVELEKIARKAQEKMSR